ncbi:MAG: radical SAM protein [Patescibacteria group bacterium]
MNSIDLVQPRHSYAPEEGQGHIYSNTSLWTAASRIIQAGGEVAQICDENLNSYEPESDIVGVNLVGPPYIQVVRERMRNLLGRRLVVGGQIVNGLAGLDTFSCTNRAQLQTLFGNDVVNGNNDEELTRTLDLENRMPGLLETSLIPAYERISDEDMREYLSREISFFLSRGCKKGCLFCASDKRMKEQYRNFEVIDADLRYLVKRASELGIPKLEIYISNQDVFQTPDKIKEFAFIVQNIQQQNPEVTIRMRGLSNSSSLVDAHNDGHTCIRDMVDAGFHTVGFGIDGGTPEVWAQQRKTHNTMDKCISSMRIAREEYDLTPEVLMVFGHQDETEKSLRSALTFTEDMVNLYGAIPRPHVAKDIVPGSDYWHNKIKKTTEVKRQDRARRIKYLMKHPEYFQSLDFTTLPNSLSHSDETLRERTEHYYRLITQLPGNTTPVIYPIAPEFSPEQNEEHRRRNTGKYDR